MPRIQVAKEFKFTYPDGKQEVFKPGTYNDVPEEVANHWFAKAHFVGAESKIPPVGTPEYADMARRKAAQLMEEARAAQAKADLAAEQQREADEAVRLAMEQARQNNTEMPRWEHPPVNPPTGAVAPTVRTPDAPLGMEREGPQPLLAMESFRVQQEYDAKDPDLLHEAAKRDEMRAHLAQNEAGAEAVQQATYREPAPTPAPEPAEAAQPAPKAVDSADAKPDRPKPVA